jgi:SAM-dependent methyltransferase
MTPTHSDLLPDRPGPPCPVCGAGSWALVRIADRAYFRCPNCAARFLDPAARPTLAQERAIYDLHDNRIDDPAYRGFLSRLADPLLARLAKGSFGLDYGCGPGPALADILARAGHRVALYDPAYFPDTEVLRVRYDFVTCTETAEHFHHPAAEFSRLDTLLRPGGWLGVMTCFQTDDARFANWHYRRDPTHVVFYRARTMHHIAAQHGWQCHIPRKDVVLFQKPPAKA